MVKILVFLISGIIFRQFEKSLGKCNGKYKDKSANQRQWETPNKFKKLFRKEKVFLLCHDMAINTIFIVIIK